MEEKRVDPARPLESHLGDLRKLLLRSFCAFGFFTALAFWKSPLLFRFLLLPLQEASARFPDAGYLGGALKTLSPAEVFTMDLKVSFIAGLLLASPFVLREIWVFVSPGLLPRERKAIFPSLLLGLFFFAGGVAFCYHLVFPMTLSFLIHYNLGLALEPQWTFERYFNFLTTFLLAFGFAFELPLAVWALSAAGVVTPDFLKAKRKWAILGIFILAAVVTPTVDVVTQSAMALPLVVLYEAGIWMAYLTRRKGEEKRKGVYH